MPGMHDRIQKDLVIKEESLWTAMSSANPSNAVLRLSGPETCILVPGLPILTQKSQPSIKEGLNNSFQRFDSYDFLESHVKVLDLMAGVVCYSVQVTRGGRAFNMMVSTSWRQDSDGEWRIFTHQQSFN